MAKDMLDAVLETERQGKEMIEAAKEKAAEEIENAKTRADAAIREAEAVANEKTAALLEETARQCEEKRQRDQQESDLECRRLAESAARNRAEVVRECAEFLLG